MTKPVDHTTPIPLRRRNGPGLLSPLALAARLRNDRIRRLRGLWVNATGLLDPFLANIVQGAIDTQLARLLAQPEGKRQAQDRAAWQEGKGYWTGYGRKRRFVLYVPTEPTP